MSTSNVANVSSGRTFLSGSSGRWAGEQLMRALREGREPGPSALRTLDTLRKDEWIAFDEALIEGALIRLRAVADLRAAGLTKPVANGLGKTVLQYEKIGDMNPAEVSMSGISKTENDRQDFELLSLPMPIIHKDFNIDIRTLIASRNRGESLDTTQVRTAGRLIAEKQEEMLFSGAAGNYGGLPIYGYTTHPDANIVNFITNGAWDQTAKTGENILADVLSMLAAAEADRMFGPYRLYVPSAYSVKLNNDFKANSDKTIRQRLLEIDRLEAVTVADQCPAGKVVLVQMTPDVIQLVEGEPLQTIQWDIQGGFITNFKGFTITVPLVRSDSEGRCGIVILEAA